MATDELAGAFSAHYAPAPLVQFFEAALESWSLGRDDALTPADLAPIGQFHFGGAPATNELAALAEIHSGVSVLDVGGGFGGPARVLAASFGGSVTVLELTEAYCEVGEMLTQRCGLSDLVSFRHGDALAMPFADGVFDRVWTQQSSMNIADKDLLYREAHRVLRPGGRLALYEVMPGSGGPLRFPVPWAADPSISFLRPPSDIRALLTAVGFEPRLWEDVTDEVVVTAGGLAGQPADAPGLHLVLGEDFRERARNGVANLAEGRARLIRAVLERM